MIRKTLIPALFLTGAALTACSPDASQPAEPSSTDADNEAVVPDDATLPEGEKQPGELSETVMGNKPEIRLQALRAEDTQDLQGELGCSFSADGELLLVAMANVGDDSRADAVININDDAEGLVGEQKGGFSALETNGGTFAGTGYVVTIETGSEMLDGPNTEEVSKAATLTTNRADGASRTYDGEWTCGP
ncbi:hypothetical protein [Henriciella litoralis]|uniref:hypothetical protein n=1 Tax=Henriciella litoralis TaxID=568102 RepID=UPI0009FD386C|nr:hypothetical protein [Henriciella litoralis]